MMNNTSLDIPPLKNEYTPLLARPELKFEIKERLDLLSRNEEKKSVVDVAYMILNSRSIK